MFTDAHCHPFDLLKRLPGAEEERRRLDTACAASSWNREQFEYHEGLSLKAQEDGAPPLVPCFAVHPQLPAPAKALDGYFDLLEEFAAAGRLGAVGETGFDLYNDEYRAAEKFQEEAFEIHLETALRRDLPLVLHLRRAMHKIFPFSKKLSKLPALIFHSWPGTEGEGESLLRRGVNAFFSFGTVLVNNHREARRCCAVFPAERILLETDAPYQPPRGKPFSSWEDLPAICAAAAQLRREAGKAEDTAEAVERITAENFYRAFAPAGKAGLP